MRTTSIGKLLAPALLVLALGACTQEGEISDNDADTVDVDTSGMGGMGTTEDPVESGHASYMAYCASCHGPEGRGNGPVAEVLTTQPADLTQLRAQYGGVYPIDSVYAYIDGRADVQAHGTREMPVWGNVWAEVEGRAVAPEQVDRRIRELVEYIRTLQEPDESV